MSAGIPRTKRWYEVRARYFYFKRIKDSGETYTSIAKNHSLSINRIRQMVSFCRRYKKKPYKETRDVYAEFKLHYDEAMKDIL